MTIQNTKRLYWTSIILFSLMMLMDGIGGVTQQEAGQEVMRHLGYPLYFLIISGVAKLLGALALLQNRFHALKEWAFAGFAFNFIGAFASRAFLQDSIFELTLPLIMLGVLLLVYASWKNYGRQHADKPNSSL